MTTLRMQDEKRIEIIQRVFRGELTVERAALMLGSVSDSVTGSKRRSRSKGPREWFTADPVSARSKRRSLGG
jgi:hypothetical protein